MYIYLHKLDHNDKSFKMYQIYEPSLMNKLHHNSVMYLKFTMCTT